MMSEVPETSGSATMNGLEVTDYLRGVESSTCLLLPTTPSPTPMDFKHPLSDQMSDSPLLMLNSDPNALQNMDSGGDSSSSADSNSVIQDPVSAQLINNISMLDYQTLTKNGDLMIGQADDVKLNGNINTGSRKLPSFVTWNWPLIRKVLLWVVLTLLVACIAAIVAMVVTIPKVCNPDLPWYQGKVFYEIFPASFSDSNDDGSGDFKGIIKRLNYIEDLGASAVRLNYIFETTNYPDNYYNITSLLKIDRSVGTLKDFQNLVSNIHDRNMHLILDIPVLSMVTPVTTPSMNNTHTILVANDSLVSYIDPTSAAIAFWARAQNVDGFYLKDLEKYTDDANFARSLQIWKQIIGNGKILMASEDSLRNAKGVNREVLASRVDLIDVHINLNSGLEGLKNRINEVLNGFLWMKPHYSWVHWNVGNVNSDRMATRHVNNTLVMLALEFSLPGTVSIFYGDEIGLSSVDPQTIEKDFHEYVHTHNLVPMLYSNEKPSSTLLWNHNSALNPKYHFVRTVRSFIQVRLKTPTVYLRGIYKDGNVMKNAEIRETDNSLVVIERWYPRRNTCVFVGNLGSKSITTDLSTMFYGGLVIASTNSSLVGENLYFEKITFPPNSAIVLKLEK